MLNLKGWKEVTHFFKADRKDLSAVNSKFSGTAFRNKGKIKTFFSNEGKLNIYIYIYLFSAGLFLMIWLKEVLKKENDGRRKLGASRRKKEQ